MTPYSLGDRVEIINPDFLPAELGPQFRWIVGMNIRPPLPNTEMFEIFIDYTLSDFWPPRNNGDLTDGYRAEDITRCV